MARERTGLKNARLDQGTFLLSDKPAKTTEEGRVSWTLTACARVMRPLVKLALAFGVKHAQLEALLRDLLLDEARRAWIESKGSEPNISQLSVTTGLNRKAVTAKVREPEDPLPHTEMSAASKTLTLWMQMFADNPARRSLPIVAEDDAPSFEAVARHASRGNVHHRAVLDELVRLNMAVEHEGRVELNATAFVPATDLKSMLAFIGDNTRDHLLAAVANTLGSDPPLLERSVFAGGISLDDCERIHQFVRERWSELHYQLTKEMTRAYDEAEASASGRIRVGIYTYYENGASEYAGELPTAPSKRSRRKA